MTNTLKPKILYFENDQMLAGMYVVKLKKLGFEPVHYTNPTEDPVGLILREKPDLILSDVIMPVLDGFAAARIYKSDKRTKHIPLIFLTNLGQKTDIDMGKDVGADNYLIKANHRPDEVINEICKTLGIPPRCQKPSQPKPNKHHKSLYLHLSGALLIIIATALYLGYQMTPTKVLNSVANTNTQIDPLKDYRLDKYVRFGDIGFRAYSKDDWFGAYEIIRNDRVIYTEISTKDENYTYDIALIEDFYTTYDINNDDVDELIVQYYSGGAHCCHSYKIFSLGEYIKEVDYLDGWDYICEFNNIGGDDKVEAIGNSGAFNYWLGSYLGSPQPKIILEIRDGKYHVAKELMKKAPPRQDEIIKLKSNVNLDYDIREALFGPMLDMLYSGNAESAWKFYDDVLPDNYVYTNPNENIREYNKADLLKEFKKQLEFSEYWQDYIS